MTADRKITILEGPDAGGKTTLGLHLVATRQADVYYHQGPYGGDPLRESLDVAGFLYGSTRRGVVFDRFHLGEQVYGPIYRAFDKLGIAGRRMLERWLLSHRTVLVKCMPDVEASLKIFETRLDDEMFAADGVEKFLAQHKLFEAARSDLPTLVYDFTTMGGALKEVVAQMDHLRAPLNEGPGAGMFARGVTLMVGEQVNVNNDANGFGPFISDISTNGCGPWLAKQLESYGVPESELYWVNARRPNGDWEDPYFISKLRPSRIIALGKTADEWVGTVASLIDWVGVIRSDQIFTVGHPSYWKRFRYNYPYPLKECFE